jgi:hypothetical protein
MRLCLCGNPITLVCLVLPVSARYLIFSVCSVSSVVELPSLRYHA